MSAKKRAILHIIPSLYIGGAEKLLLNTILLYRELEHHVVTFDGDPEFLKSFREVSTVHLKKSRFVFTLSNILFIRKLAKEINPVAIHSHLLKANWLSRFAFRSRKNLFNTIHSPYSRDAFCHNTYSLWVEKYSYLYSNVVLIFVSDYVRDDYVNYITLGKKDATLPNFVTDNFFRIAPPAYEPMTPLKLVAVGNIKYLKNYGILLNAFKQLKHLPISLDIYGTGEMESTYIQEVEKHSLNVHFRGVTDAVDKVLGQYHALIFPSFYEGFSIALLEAMAARLPLILSDIPMFRRLAMSNAYFFNPEDVQECVRVILMCYKEGFPADAVYKNYDFVKGNFTEAIYKKRLNQIYSLKVEPSRLQFHS